MGAGAADPGNPQSWNRFGYVSGKPDVLTDPSGLCEICLPPVGPIPIAVDIIGAIFSLFDIFGGGSPGSPIQVATHQMIHRANSGTIWSESNGLPAGMAVPQPSIAGMLGVTSGGPACDFGVCGTPTADSFTGPKPGDDPAWKLSSEDLRKLIGDLLERAKKAVGAKNRNQLLKRARELSKRASKRAHQGNVDFLMIMIDPAAICKEYKLHPEMRSDAMDYECDTLFPVTI